MYNINKFTNMNVLIIGSGGREHAFGWKIAQSTLLKNLYFAPGNAGTTELGTNLNISVNDFDGIKNACIQNQIDLVVVGPEDPLVNGVHDYFLADAVLKNIPVIGPQKHAAQLEGSKEFSKKFMLKHNVPTAAYASFTANELNEGLQYLTTQKPPFVLKADGLAAGKGVVILDNLQDAQAELTAMLKDAKFGKASSKVVIEEFMQGIELSVFVLTDGKDYVILPAAKDYKRIGEGDTGLNTGGMGAISPVPFANEDFILKVKNKVVEPTIKGLQADNIPYKGFIFIGLMNMDGEPKVVEYNVRMGDPETEVVIPRIESDFLDLLYKTGKGDLKSADLKISNQTATTVIMVSGGYPEDYEKGKVISNLDKTSNSIVFHSGTKEENGNIVSNGGRVLAITSFGKDFKEALAKSYKNTEIINYEGKYFRSDLGKDLEKYLG
jgi:phosphoribosylamine--glycine ligase